MDEDDDFGSDDGFDALPANTLAQLEQDALRSTQHRQHASLHHDRSNGRFGVDRYNHSRKYQSGFAPEPEYGLDDEEVVDLDNLPQDLGERYGQWGQDVPSLTILEGDGHQESREPDEKFDPTHNADVAELRRRVRELEGERSVLQKAVNEAHTLAQSKAGEAAVLRQRVDKTSREYELKLSTLRQLHAESEAKQQAEFDAVKRDREKIATDNRFLQHDLALESGRNRQNNRAIIKTDTVRHADSRNQSPATTPRKLKVLPYRDGFEDEDIMILSPSKTRSGSKPSTPLGGAKRKRNVEPQSPIRPLELHSSQHEPAPKANPSVDSALRVNLEQSLQKEKESLRLLQRLLDLRVESTTGIQRLMEVLTTFSFPSKPSKTLSAMLYNGLSSPNLTKHPEGIARQICDTFIDLWSQCLKESYYTPIDVIVDALQFLLSSRRQSLTRALVNSIVPLAISSCDVVAIPLAKASLKQPFPRADLLQQAEQPPIDVLKALKLLNMVAQACASDDGTARAFWQLVNYDFILVLLLKVQPLPQILLMLQILRASVLPTSFGAICLANESKQSSREVDIVGQLSLLLFVNFDEKHGKGRPNTTSPNFNEEGLNPDRRSLALQIRLEIAMIFLMLCTTDHGTDLIALHKHALGRLIRFLHASVGDLYTFSSATHNVNVMAVNTTMRVIHHVLTTAADKVDIRERLRVVSGGVHMWLIALTRLAFMEGLVAEAGITPETSDMAHQLLDEYLSPDEGEQLLKLFSSGGDPE